jgi:hypothetical protein
MPANDSTHTPGPWFVQCGAVYAQGDNDFIGIASADRNDSRTSPCERDRNVDLMAAAPNMLQLLRFVFANTRVPRARYDLPGWLRDEIKAVIKTAEGKDRP